MFCKDLAAAETPQELLEILNRDAHNWNRFKISLTMLEILIALTSMVIIFVCYKHLEKPLFVKVIWVVILFGMMADLVREGLVITRN